MGSARSKKMSSDSDQDEDLLCMDMDECIDDCMADLDVDKEVSTGDTMMKIVSLQKFDGSWCPSIELAKILKVTEEDLQAKYKVS